MRYSGRERKQWQRQFKQACSAADKVAAAARAEHYNPGKVSGRSDPTPAAAINNMNKNQASMHVA